MADLIPHRFLAQAERHPDHPGYYTRSPDGQWNPTSWKDYVGEARRVAKALIATGLEPRQACTILGFNRGEWTTFYHGTMLAGGVPVGIYTTCSAVEVQYIVHHCESLVIVVEDLAQWEKIKEQRDNLPHLKKCVLMKGAPAVDDPLVCSWDAFLALGDGVDDSALTERLDALKPDDLGTLIYTSGTTGPPKGVMLTHDNLAWTAGGARDVVHGDEHDCNVSYLPLSHIAEQVFTIHLPACVGNPVYFARSISGVADDLKEVQPTLLFGVPRVWEKFHAGVEKKLAAATGVKARLVSWARGVGTQVTDLRNKGQEPSGLLGLQYKIAKRLVFTKIHEALGLGRVKMCVSGAAPLNPEIQYFFAGLDLIIYEVYGQSEDTGPTSINVPGRTRFGSVGPVWPGIEVKIAEDDEILVKGRNVFAGYYKEPEETASTLVDGWLHSGDLGKFDEDGFLSIIGRKKEIIITAGGKNIAPKNIEAALKNAPMVNEAVVIGDRRKFLSALLTLDPDSAEAFAKEHGLEAQHMHNSQPLRALIQKGVDETNKHFAQVEHIRKFTVLPRNFTVEDGELTPSLKIKRRVVNENWSEQIEAMYAD